MSRYVACLILLCSALPALRAAGAIPLPGALLHGTVHINGEQIIATDPDEDGIAEAKVIVIARVDLGGTEHEVGRYRFGDQQNDHARYALRVRLEWLADGLTRSGNAATLGDTVKIYVRDERDPDPANHTETHVADFPAFGGIPAPGIIAELNLPAEEMACVYGDFDRDEDIDLTDFEQFAKCLGAPVPRSGCPVNLWMCTDVNRNGTIDLYDFSVFATLFGRPPIACPCGDFDIDNDIDLTDFGIFAGCFGLSAPTESCPATLWTCTDLNQNGTIDLRDYGTFTVLFATTPGALVPPNCGGGSCRWPLRSTGREASR